METRNKKILVVEDEPSYQRILKEKLGSEGYEVISAMNGEDGLAQAFKYHPELILLDIRMPKMDGLEMIKMLRYDVWGKTAKVIMLTNISEVEKVQQAIESEVFIYLVKADTKLEYIVDRIKEMAL
jgi:CheY-like chemotaxis protein